MAATLRQLLERRAKLVADMRALADAADTADDGNGGLTPEQQAAFDKLKAALMELEQAIANRSVVEDMERRMAGQPLGGSGDRNLDRECRDPGNMDVGRGASSLGALARKVFTLFPMSAAEAADWSVHDPSHYFRLDGAKANHDARNGCEWFERHAVQLDNGDMVARAEPWKPPRENLNDETIGLLLTMIGTGDRGQPWSKRLGRYDRSISKAMEGAGIATRVGQKAALEALFARGVVEATWAKLNRDRAMGLRHPDGGPDVRWTD